MQAAPWVRAKMQKEMEAGSWRGKAKEGDNESGAFKPDVLAQYREDTMRTTGADVAQILPTLARVPGLRNFLRALCCIIGAYVRLGL